MLQIYNFFMNRQNFFTEKFADLSIIADFSLLGEVFFLRKKAGN